MRTSKSLIALLTLALAATVGLAAYASASGPNEHANASATSSSHPANETADDNETAARHNGTRGDNESARHDELAHARHAALASFQENRSAALQAYRDTLESIRASFLANKTAVIDACKAARANNTTDDHCVKDGLKPLIEKAHADIRAAQEKLHDRLVALRTAAIVGFLHERHDINVRHGRDG